MLTGALYGDRLAGMVIVDSPVNPPDRPGGPPKREIKPHHIYPTLAAAHGAVPADAAADGENLYLVDWVARHSLKEVAGRLHLEVRSGDLAALLHRRHGGAAEATPNAASPCSAASIRSCCRREIGEYMFNLLGRSAPVVEIPQAQHHIMLDQPLALVAALRALLADWDHSTATRRRPFKAAFCALRGRAFAIVPPASKFEGIDNGRARRFTATSRARWTSAST